MENNYKKLFLIGKIKKNKYMPNEIIYIILQKFKLELIYEKTEKNKKKLTKSLKHLVKINSRKIDIKKFKIIIDGQEYFTDYDNLINHWSIYYEIENSITKSKLIIYNECARQMIHCCKCGEYICVSTNDETWLLSDNIYCNCNPFRARFIDSKYYISEW